MHNKKNITVVLKFIESFKITYFLSKRNPKHVSPNNMNVTSIMIKSAARVSRNIINFS